MSGSNPAAAATSERGGGPATGATWVWPVRWVAVSLAGLVIGYAALAVVASFFYREQVEIATYAQPFERIEVESSTGDIRIRVAAGPMRMRATVGSSFGSGGSRLEADGDTLRLSGRCRFDWLPDRCSVAYDITVPPGTVVGLVSGTGDIALDGADARIRAELGTGDFTGRDLTSDDVSVDTGTGDVVLTFVEAPRTVYVTSGTGDLTVGVPRDGAGYRVTAETGLGDVRGDLIRDDTASRSIDAQAGTGDIRLVTGAAP